MEFEAYLLGRCRSSRTRRLDSLIRHEQSRFVVFGEVDIFSQSSKNLHGSRLETYKTGIKHMSTNRTRAGLNVNAVLNPRTCEAGEKVTAEEMEMVRIRLHKEFQEWNHRIKPQFLK